MRAQMVETSLTLSTSSANSRFFLVYRLHINTVSTFYVYARTIMMSPRVLASGPKPCGGNKNIEAEIWEIFSLRSGRFCLSLSYEILRIF